MKRRYPLVIAVACFALISCSSEQHSDLRQFVKDSDSMPRGRIPPLPEVKPYEPFEYAAFDLIDPFVPRKIEAPKLANVPGALQPPKDHRKGPLEAFPLENLKMVGTLQQQKNFYALIKTPDNNLYRVKPGDFVGQNFGRIIDINESAVKLKELIQDSGSEWKEEERTLLLQE
ncbi:MAG TPA: pilus assembly protein PilP [Burkholderiales bacterium]|nr:pilus assembly protein PilP [Burkholderiales bacterium]